MFQTAQLARQIRNMLNYTNLVTTACDRNIEMAVKILT